MLPFTNLSLDDRERVVKAVGDSGMRNSEMNFASMYIWRHAWNTQVCFADGAMYVLEHKPMDDEPAHVLPVLTSGPLAPALERLIEDVAARGFPFLMRSVDDERKSMMEAALPGAFIFNEDRDFFDYIYNGEDLRLLTGNRYHAKRNHVNRFAAEFAGRWAYRDVSGEEIASCLELFDRWGEGRGEQESVALEREAIVSALTSLDALRLRCGAVAVDGRVEAFSVGEQVGDTAFIHLEKANTLLHDGMFAVINNQFACNAFPSAVLFNREEDVGIEGLRRAKQSYHPCRMERKYVARLARR